MPSRSFWAAHLLQEFTETDPVHRIEVVRREIDQERLRSGVCRLQERSSTLDHLGARMGRASAPSRDHGRPTGGGTGARGRQDP
jgi:hypothetical protein